MEATLYNNKGQKAGTITLPEGLFNLPWNADLVHQVVSAMQSSARPRVAHAKTRGEVRGGGKKPWQQKGTGRARHGSTRSPLWKGGGVTHGPRNEKDYSRKVNRQAKRKALFVALSRKLRDGEIIFVDSLELPAPKTKEAKAALTALNGAGLALKRTNAALIALPSAHAPTRKSFSNFGNVAVEDVRNLNPVSVLTHKYVVMVNPQAAIEIFGKKKVAAD